MTKQEFNYQVIIRGVDEIAGAFGWGFWRLGCGVINLQVEFSVSDYLRIYGKSAGGVLIRFNDEDEDLLELPQAGIRLVRYFHAGRWEIDHRFWKGTFLIRSPDTELILKDHPRSMIFDLKESKMESILSLVEGLKWRKNYDKMRKAPAPIRMRDRYLPAQIKKVSE